MRIDAHLTDDAVLRELGARVARMRLDRNLSQELLAHEAGISKRTLERIENGQAVQMPSFLRVGRSLGFLAGFEVAVPAPTISPVQLHKLQNRQRKHATRRSAK